MVSAHNNVRNFDFFVPSIWSRLHDKGCLYILSSSKNAFFSIVTSRDTFNVSIEIYRENTLTLLYFDFQQSTPRKCKHSTTFFFLVLPFRLDLLQPRTQPQKFHQTPKETNNQHGRRHMPSRTCCYIFIYQYLTWNTLSTYILKSTGHFQYLGVFFYNIRVSYTRTQRNIQQTMLEYLYCFFFSCISWYIK